MDDLISRKALLEQINNLCSDGNEDWIGTDNQSFVNHADVVDIIADAPAVEAEPVKHGRWERQKYYGGVRKGIVARIICSECGYPNEKTNYCPNCGAKMDGG